MKPVRGTDLTLLDVQRRFKALFEGQCQHNVRYKKKDVKTDVVYVVKTSLLF